MKPLALALALSLSAGVASAATMACNGEIVDVQDPSEKERKHALRKFSVKIDYYDYCSRGKFGRESVVGERPRRRS